MRRLAFRLGSRAGGVEDRQCKISRVGEKPKETTLVLMMARLLSRRVGLVRDHEQHIQSRKRHCHDSPDEQRSGKALVKDVQGET